MAETDSRKESRADEAPDATSAGGDAEETVVPPEEEGFEGPHLISAWEQRREAGPITAFLRTAWLVMRRNGRLGDQLDLPLDYAQAKRFRWAALVPLLLVTGITVVTFIAPSVLPAVVPELEADDEIEVSVLALGGVGVLVLTVVQWMLWTGMVSWFFAPRGLDPQRRHRAAAVGYYLAGPLALLAVPATLGIPVASEAAGLETPEHAELFRMLSTAGVGAVMVYWLQLILFAARDVAGRGPAGLVATGLGLIVLWTVSSAMVWLLPLGVLMWGMMHYSLSF